MKMDPFFDIDELFRDFDPFSSRFTDKIQRRMEALEEAVKNGKLKGDWDFKRIDKPGVKGYIIQGRFWTDEPFEAIEPFDIFEPFRPGKRRPTPQRPFKIPDEASEEVRDPLTDVFEEDDAVKVYVELPGEEEGDIQVNFKEGKVEVKAKKFYKMIQLPTENIDQEKTASKYKNGVLELTIPKKEKFTPVYHKI